LERTISLINLSSLQLNNNEGGSINRKKVSFSTSTRDLSNNNCRRPSEFITNDNSRRPSEFIHQKLDILIVDDSGLSRKMLSRLLRTSGYVFDEAGDGVIALEKVKAKMSGVTYGSEKDSFDAILMDFVMPNMDGPTATKAIRDMGYTAPIFGKY
jgi:PleD family two-component response regulator